MAGALPEEFKDLESLVDAWALPTESTRKEKRASSSWDDLLMFSKSIEPRLAPIAAYLDAFPLTTLAQPEQHLLHLAMMYMDVALAIEFYGQPENADAFPRSRFLIADLPRLENGAPC